MRLRAALLALVLLCAGAFGAQASGQAGAQPKQGDVPTAPVLGAPATQRPELPIVRSIKVEGAQRYSAAQLINALGQKTGELVDPDAIDRGLRTLWLSFHVRGNVDRLPLPTANPTAKPEVELLLSVVEMPSDREPRFIGNVEIDTKTLKRWALIEERVELFEYQASRVRQRLIEGYHREGFFWAEVDIAKRDMALGVADSGGPMTDLIFDIREGPKVRVKGVHVRGNRSMPDKGFGFWKEGLTSFASPQLSPPGIFNWYGNPFVQETLDADVLAMRNVYRERGWLDARVEVENLEWSDDRSELQVYIVIDEGEPYVVDEVNVEFVEFAKDDRGDWLLKPVDGAASHPRFTPEELLARCEMKKGVRYEEITVKRDESKLREYYGAQGHLSHPSLPNDLRWDFREPVLFFNPAEHKLRVTYRIVEGHPLTLREISFGGTSHTRDEVLRREVGVFPGGKADQKEINRSLARIQGTGFFSDQFSPEAHHEPSYRYLEVPGTKELIDLEYLVEEGRVVEFQLSGGIDSNDGLFGLIQLSLKNFDVADMPSKWNRTLSELFRKEAFHGGGQKVDLELSPGTKVSRARVHFIEPDIFNRYLEPISFDIDLSRQLRLFSTHDEERFDKRLKFSRRFGFDTFVSVGVVHSDIDVSDVTDNGAPASLQRQEALGATVQSGFTLDISTRALDNYISPHNGWKVGLRNTLYTDLLSSDFEYLRSDLQFDGYKATGTKDDGTQHVLHLEFDGGIMPTYGSTDEIPYTERFFQGGSSSLRGFRLRGAGDRGGDVLGFPTQHAAGGESYMSGSVEWLYPLYSTVQPGTYKAIESLRGVLFVDWGVLGDTASDIDLNDTRASVGFGVGLAYPLPIQLNFGFPVRRFSGDERQTFSFSIGIGF